MANTSILAAFERMWLHVVAAVGGKADIGHTHTEYMAVTNPVGTGSFSMGRKPDTTIGDCSHAEGYVTIASGDYSHAEGDYTEASGDCSHAEGDGTIASGDFSHAEGKETTASSFASHAEGHSTTVTSDNTVEPITANVINAGYYGHAEGYGTVSFGMASHAEGNGTLASGNYSHAEGNGTLASGNYSHAEGNGTTASGDCSHAEGRFTTASGDCSHAEGNKTEALSYQHVQGHYNKIDSNDAGNPSGTGGTAFIIGNGTSISSSNAFRITYAGKPYSQSSMSTSGADYAEFFEWQDLNPNFEDRRGYFVTLYGEKIKIAEPNDYILGIVSALPAIIGNGDECWRGKHILDEFGAFITEEFEYEVKVFDKETGEEKTVTKTGTKYKENPDYDPSLPYIQREDRPEWDAVGMMGVLSVRDDGTCEVNGYCKVAEGGIATASENGYRVIKRVNNNVIKVVFR